MGILLLLLVGASLPAPITAQVLPGRPSRPPTAEELRRAPDIPSEAPAVRVDSGRMVAGPCPQAIANSPLSVPLARVAFAGPDGSQLPSSILEVLASVGDGLDGSPKPLSEVCRLRDEANAALARARYIASVQIGLQALNDGVLRLTVVSGRITELRVRGDAGRGQARLESQLRQLQALDPLNEYDVERILLLVNDVPGVSITLELRPSLSGRPGEVIGEIALERSTGSVVMNVQNLGSEQLGRWSAQVRGELYGLTGLADRTYLSLFSTTDFTELAVFQAGHDFGIGEQGLRLGGDFTYAKTRPTLDNAVEGLDLESESVLGSLRVSYPLHRSLGGGLWASGGLDLIDQRTRTLGQPINIDKIRTLFARLDGDLQPRSTSVLAPPWRIGGNVALRKGIDILSATQVGEVQGTAVPSRFEGNAQAFVMRAGLVAESRVRFGPQSPYAVTLAADLRGQWADDPLLAYDEFAVGNLTLGRGYDPGATAGDRAFGGAFELRVGKPVPLSNDDWAAEALGFYDHVHIRNLDSNEFERERALASVGGGVRVTWGGRARLDLIYAKPLDRALEIDQERPPGRLLLSLTVRALPWR